MITCSNCQEQVQDGKKFCTRCGQPIAQPDQGIPVQNSTAAIVPTTPLIETAVPPFIEDRSPISTTDNDALSVEELSATAPFEALPDGAFAGNHYLITHTIETRSNLNNYYVEDKTSEGGFLPFILKESNDWQILSPELDIAALKLPRDGLRPPEAGFQQRIGGSTRYYVVLPQAGHSLADIDSPVEAPKVVSWGATLARGLAILHEYKIAFGTVARPHIQLDGDQAYLSDFRGCLMSAAPQQCFDDVRQLANILYQLMTGTPEYSPTVDLPENLKGVFAQIMTDIQQVSAADFAKALALGVDQIRRPDSIDLRVGRKTDVGMLRQLNEDSLFTIDMVWNNQSISRPVGVFVVADGMGGHEGGEVASGLTIDTIGRLTAQDLLGLAAESSEIPNIENWLISTVQAANNAVFEKGRESHTDMGTTVVMALMVGNEAYLAHVGDSRAYRVTDDNIEAITTDHSLVESLVATNQITREEARYHPQSNVIYRTIGDKRTVEVDITQACIGPGEYLVLCSDGLNGMITDEAIHNIIINAHSPQAACEGLISAANAVGGEDNITVIVVKSEALH